MAVSIIRELSRKFREVERVFIYTFFGKHFPPPEALSVSIAHHDGPILNKNTKNITLSDIIGDGFLYGVPKFRRTVEKRWKRKFGVPEYAYKMLIPKTNLRDCVTCGNHHEAGVLCPHCYSKVKEETKLMQNKIQEELKLNPIEEEVVVLYDGEKLEKPEEFWKGKRVVEMQKPRPEWFSKNLLQKTTQQPATSTDIKPTELA